VPGKAADLAATVASHTAVNLTWTAPGGSDDGTLAKAASYQVFYSKTPITTDEQCLAGTVATNLPSPKNAGEKESVTISGLDSETAYNFCLRAWNTAKNAGPIAFTGPVTTWARAEMLITEVAPTTPSDTPSNRGNTKDTRFVELVVTKAGWAADLEVTQVGQTGTTMHKFASFNVAVGDRIVVHMSSPDGCVQEDAVGDKTASKVARTSDEAFDVYSSTHTSITSTNNVVAIVDGTKMLDVVAFSSRSIAPPATLVAAASMTAFAAAKTNNMWNFTLPPVRGTNDCETVAEAVAISTRDGDTCGKFDTGFGVGFSINRYSKDGKFVDTNTRADFYVAKETPGKENTPVPAPKLIKTTVNASKQVELTFDQEMDADTIAPDAFEIKDLEVEGATSAANRVLLTTKPEAEGSVTVTVASTVTNLQGIPMQGSDPGDPDDPCDSVAQIVISEVNHALPRGADLIELTVTSGGSIAGFQVRANPTGIGATGTLLATLPEICAKAGDIVVVHLVPTNVTVADGLSSSETDSKDQFPQAEYSANYDNAWDVRGGTTGLSSASNVVALRSPADVR
jgi:hypothetical protein